MCSDHQTCVLQRLFVGCIVGSIVGCIVGCLFVENLVESAGAESIWFALQDFLKAPE